MTSTMTSTIQTNYQQLQQQLHQLKQQLSEQPLIKQPPSATQTQNARILPVSKTKPAADIRTLYQIGVTEFAENYLKEALEKQQQLTDCPNIQWHYIGKIQTKKCKQLAQHMHWVHTIDNLKHAQLLATERQQHNLPPLNICIQVNIDHEPQKNGVDPQNALNLAQNIQRLSGLNLRGIMLIGRFDLTAKQKKASFQTTYRLFQLIQNSLKINPPEQPLDQPLRQSLEQPLNQQSTQQPTPSLNLPLDQFDTLSMGMSNDWQLAIQCGATIVRLGTTIFGKR